MLIGVVWELNLVSTKSSSLDPSFWLQGESNIISENSNLTVFIQAKFGQ